jgi:hypothetical protein
MKEDMLAKTSESKSEKGRQQESEESVLVRLRQKIDSAYTAGDVEEVAKKINAFAYKLKEKYPRGGGMDPYDRALFHLLIGGTIHIGETAHFDFKGEDSIENFINSL